MSLRDKLKKRLVKAASRLGPPLAALPLVAQTDTSSAVNTTVTIVSSVIPLMVMVLVLKLLFSSFKEIGK